jgi:hypothetical protein
MHFGTYGKAHDADKVESLAVLFFFFFISGGRQSGSSQGLGGRQQELTVQFGSDRWKTAAPASQKTRKAAIETTCVPGEVCQTDG